MKENTMRLPHLLLMLVANILLVEVSDVISQSMAMLPDLIFCLFIG